MSTCEDIDGAKMLGSLAMFERMIFRGHLLRLYHPGGVHVPVKPRGPLDGIPPVGEGGHRGVVPPRPRQRRAGRAALCHLERTATRDTGQTKEDLTRTIAERDGITDGLVCILRALEPCRSFNLRGSTRQAPDPRARRRVGEAQVPVATTGIFVTPSSGSCTSACKPGFPSASNHVNGGGPVTEGSARCPGRGWRRRGCRRGRW